jgi:hypothetical protein
MTHVCKTPAKLKRAAFEIPIRLQIGLIAKINVLSAAREQGIAQIPIRLQIGLLAGLQYVSQGGMYKIKGKFDDPSLRRKFYKWKTVFS